MGRREGALQIRSWEKQAGSKIVRITITITITVTPRTITATITSITLAMRRGLLR